MAQILLVNPNTMKKPPVIPVGLEYLITALKKHEHDVDVLDLCYSKNPKDELLKVINGKKYDIVGFTIRNIDSAQFNNNEYYLPEIRKLVRAVKTAKIPVILGGAGFSAMSEEIHKFLGADYGIIGPGEKAFPDFLDIFSIGGIDRDIFDGNRIGIDPELEHLRGHDFDYKRYLSKDGVVGFETHVGCMGSCPYCVEADSFIGFKKIPNIIKELSYVVKNGYNHFHTCDCEFNSNLDFSLQFCRALVKEKLDIRWAAYIKPAPYSEEFFKILSKSNAYLVTLSVDSSAELQKNGGYAYRALEKILSFCKKYKIKLAIDLLTGYPNESLESIKEMITFLKENPPDRVSVAYQYRVYKHTKLAQLIKSDKKLRQHLDRPLTRGDAYLKPIFYSQPIKEEIEEMIAGDKHFELAGVKPGVNYTKLR